MESIACQAGYRSPEHRPSRASLPIKISSLPVVPIFKCRKFSKLPKQLQKSLDTLFESGGLLPDGIADPPASGKNAAVIVLFFLDDPLKDQ
ncbi:hypothetical protein [Janthinobacterium sp. 64]|uniref:hypothetical protein n=1 Tax=Janthinobacterium sp. 64 TaxID=2035208 RepID=UPI0012FD3258|nr:hypothetical protein [Janthinobacterium sp. 64]